MVIPQKGGLCANSLEPDYKAEDLTILRLLRGGAYLSLPGWTLNVITCIPIREGRGAGDRHTKEKTQKRRQCDHRGRDWSDVATAKGHPEPPEVDLKSSQAPSEGPGPTSTQISGFWSRALQRTCVCCFTPSVCWVCYSSHRKLKQRCFLNLFIFHIFKFFSDVDHF